MFSATVPANTIGDWGTTEIRLRRVGRWRAVVGRVAMVMVPVVGG